MHRRLAPIRSVLLSTGVCAALVLAGGEARAAGPAPIELGTAETFAVLGGTTVTSAGKSTLTGDLGVSPGTAMTGFAAGDVSGTMHFGDAVAAQAHDDTAAAYASAAERSPAAPAGVLDGLTLGPGVHASGAALSLAGGLTLDAGGDPDAVFILRAGTTLTTAAGSHVELAGGAQACNVFWQVGTSATLGAISRLTGTILATTSITMGDGVAIDGRALARDGGVTMIADSVSVPHCDVAAPVLSLAPTFGDFPDVTLTGREQKVSTSVSAWRVTDTTGAAPGWSVNISADVPRDLGSGIAMTGATLALKVPDVTTGGEDDSTAPVVAGKANIIGGGVNAANAAPGTGGGVWNFAEGATQLELTIPPDARAGSYTTTITTTLNAAV